MNKLSGKSVHRLELEQLPKDGPHGNQDSKMQKVVIAFDVDGTLIDSEGNTNWRITELLRILSRFKNVEIIVWSGGGKSYAEMIVRKLDLEKYVKRCEDKNHIGKDEDGKHLFDPSLKPDIAIDDIQACVLGKINLIVREK